MKNIGIYLASEPSGGGTYQYNLSMLLALESLNQNKYSVTTFYHCKSWENLIPLRFNKVHVNDSFFLKRLGGLYKKIDRSAEGWRRFAFIFNPIISKINNSSCDLVIFPSQDNAAYQTTKKSLSTIHDLMHRYESHFEEYQNGEHNRREKHYSMTCKYVDGILVDSSVGKEHVVESYGIPEEKIYILPFVPPLYLLESKEIDVISKYNLPINYLFYPAQFWEHKNHINLLKAIKIVKDKNIEVNLVLVGSKKNNYNSVLGKINELSLNNNVYILGYVSNDDMASLYKNAIATTFVSLIGPTNIPPLEALTLGSPLICSNAYAMPEQVGDAALLVDPKNAQDIAEKIQMLIENRELALSLVSKGLKRIEQYGPKDFTTKLESYICNCISN